MNRGFFKIILGPDSLYVFLENAFCSAISTRLVKDLIVRTCSEVRRKAGSRRICRARRHRKIYCQSYLVCRSRHEARSKAEAQYYI